MRLEHLGEAPAAAAVMRAIEAVPAADEVRTRDPGGRATTAEMADAPVCAVSARG